MKLNNDDAPIQQAVRGGIVNTTKIGDVHILIDMLGHVRWPVDDHTMPIHGAVRRNIREALP